MSGSGHERFSLSVGHGAPCCLMNNTTQGLLEQTDALLPRPSTTNSRATAHINDQRRGARRPAHGKHSRFSSEVFKVKNLHLVGRGKESGWRRRRRRERGEGVGVEVEEERREEKVDETEEEEEEEMELGLEV